MGPLSGSVISLYLAPAVVGEARQDRERRVVIEAIGLVEIRYVLARLAEGRHLHLAVEPEGLLHRDGDIGQGGAPLGRIVSRVHEPCFRRATKSSARQMLRRRA